MFKLNSQFIIKLYNVNRKLIKIFIKKLNLFKILTIILYRYNFSGIVI